MTDVTDLVTDFDLRHVDEKRGPICHVTGLSPLDSTGLSPG